MQGYYNRILNINLTNQSFTIEPVDDSTLKQCLGGKGLATKLLLERNPPGVDPLAPDNHIIIATGPFCGGPLWGGSRYGLFTKSPLTHFYTESYSGGKVPEAIDSTGFDAILISGKAHSPCILVITPNRVEFKEAGDVWGMDTFASEQEVLRRFPSQKYKKQGAITIGPAGEHLVRFAIVANDKWRCAGRTGVGAVFGSKLLKSIVFHGDQKRQYADPEGATNYAKNFLQDYKEHPGVKAYKKLGTTMMVSLMNTFGAFPSKYWKQGSCEHSENISGEKYHDEHEVRAKACAKCFLACGRMTRISKGRHKNLKIEGPEYETIFSFGGLCMIKEMEEVAYINDLCDRLGMDTITAGNLCALMMEASSLQRTNYTIEYGNADQTITLLESIAAREGEGDILAEGIIAASKNWGLEDLAVHVKGLEPAGYDPRKLKGMGLTFATTPRGACHMRTTFYKPELSGMIPPEQVKGKAKLLIEFEDRLNIFDCLTLCRFYRDIYPWGELETTLHLVTGKDFTENDLRTIASYITDMTRQFNIREGLTELDDKLPKRLHQEALPDGGKLTENEQQVMLKDYYYHRGWDKNGIPISLSTKK